jgi:hypothetical protein
MLYLVPRMVSKHKQYHRTASEGDALCYNFLSLLFFLFPVEYLRSQKQEDLMKSSHTFLLFWCFGENLNKIEWLKSSTGRSHWNDMDL